MNYLLKYTLWRNLKKTLEGRSRDREHPESGRIMPLDIHLIVNHAIKEYQDLIVAMPAEKTLGARVMVKNGIWSLERA